jgi:hypothetical protein
MKTKEQQITSSDILEHWRQGKSTLDWRPLTIKEKREWLRACVTWTGLPKEKIKSFDYLIDGNQIYSDVDFYCLLGEAFFGYRGYFGQDSHGFNDCFAEISLQTKNKETVEKGAKVIFKNSDQVRDTLGNEFQHVVKSFQDEGFEIEFE